MWFREYRDYPIDHSLKQEQVEPRQGIIGCEMHEINGWGTDREDFIVKKSLWRRLRTFFSRQG